MGIRTDIGIDLGTASVLIFVKGKGIILEEPSVVAINTDNNKILEVGNAAREMIGKTPGNIIATRPLKDGVISDFDVTEKMIKYFIKKVAGSNFFHPRIIVCVPSGITEVEKKAVIDACNNAGAKKTFVIEEPVAAAIGAGIDISLPSGNMVIDIGGGTTDIAVISLGGIVVSKSIKVAGDKCDEAIQRYIKKKYNVIIGLRSAEDLKKSIGTAVRVDEEKYMSINGKNLVTGLPKEITVSSTDMYEALEEAVNSIADAVHGVFEKTPPELSSDISKKGIVMTGGGSLVEGLSELISKRTGVACRIADDPILCVALGTGKCLKNIEQLNNTLLSDEARKDYR